MEVNLSENVCEESVFKFIFSKHYKVLRNYLNYKFRDEEIADEYAQNAFLILWENCGKIKPIQSKKFLFTTSYRLVLNHYRRLKIDKKHKTQLNTSLLDEELPDLIFDENELNLKIYAAINALPEKQRLVFMMNRFEDQTYKDIAELLDISVKAVEKRMQRALLNLRLALK
jgi:RNA polymerase sigma-70 factor (family 1)